MSEKLLENHISIRMEGYDEPLLVKVNPKMEKSELKEFFSEIIENYIADMKEKKLLTGPDEDILLVDRVS